MSKQKTQIATLALPDSGSNSPGGSLLIKKYLFHWPLFVLSVVLTMVLAYLYLNFAKPIYPITATLEFKAPTASSASLTVNQSSAEQQLDPIDKPVIVENELEIMQSKKILYQVVNELQLWISYTQKKGLSSKDLYKQSPVAFQFVKQEQDSDLGADGKQLNITIKNRDSFTYKDESGVVQTAKFSTPVKSSFGIWKLQPTAIVTNYIDSNLVIGIANPDLVSDALQKGIKVELENKDAPFVNLSIADNVPERGKDVLNALMDLYLKYALQDKNKLSHNTLNFIDYRLDSVQKELTIVEKQVEDYKIQHHITVSVDTEAIAYQNIKQTNLKAINDIDIQLNVISSLDKYAGSVQFTDKLPVSFAGLTDASLSVVYDKLSDLQTRRAQLLATLPETNPLVTSTDAQIKVLKDNFREKLASVKSSLLAQKQKIQSIIGTTDAYLGNVPTRDREFNVLKRLQQTKERIYRFLLEKREQVALRYASSIADAEIIDDAHASKAKWPIGAVVYMLALIIGLAAAAGILYLRESLNDLILTRDQIEDETSVPILGELAYQNTDTQIVISEGRSKFAIGEQFRVLRTNLYHLHSNSESGRVTLFTSSVSGEGKSFVSSNLAVTLAYASRKSIILEMDLRKPKVSINFGLSPEHIGISNYLNEEITDLNKIIQPSGIPGLDVLSCGSILPNPSELLEKTKLDELIELLKARYDEIIIDSPPIHLVTDALVIARVADASLYVVRQGYTHKHELEFINEINETERFPKFTIIFNGIKRSTSSNYGYGGYGYGYGGYGNAYNAYAVKEKRTFAGFVKAILARF